MSSRPPRVIISVHDVSPATAPESRRWVRDLDERGVPGSLLVVPGPWRDRDLAADVDFAAWLRSCEARGHEVSLHGWDHTAVPVRGRRWNALVGDLVARGCAEFWSLDEDEAAERAGRGLEVFAACGLTGTGFTPPGWLASPAAVRGLRRAGVSYVTSHGAVTDLRTGHKVRAPVICHRPHSRAERTGAALMSRGATPLLRAGRTLRIALHPDDLLRPGLREATLRGIDASLEAGAAAVTYEALVAAIAGPEDLRSGTATPAGPAAAGAGQ